MKQKNHNELVRELKKLVQETIRLIKNYLDSYSENIPPLVLRNIVELYKNENYRELLVRKSDIGQSLFTNLQLYVKARHTFLEALITQALASKKRPMFSSKLILDYASRGLFPVTQQVEVKGVSLSGLRKALISLIHRREIKSKSRLIKKEILPEPIRYLIWKREIIGKIKELILREVNIAGGACPVRYLLTRHTRPVNEKAAIYRTIALIQLIRNNALELVKRNNEFIVKLSEYE